MDSRVGWLLYSTTSVGSKFCVQDDSDNNKQRERNCEYNQSKEYISTSSNIIGGVFIDPIIILTCWLLYKKRPLPSSARKHGGLQNSQQGEKNVDNARATRKPTHILLFTYKLRNLCEYTLYLSIRPPDIRLDVSLRNAAMSQETNNKGEKSIDNARTTSKLTHIRLCSHHLSNIRRVHYMRGRSSWVIRQGVSANGAERVCGYNIEG